MGYGNADVTSLNAASAWGDQPLIRTRILKTQIYKTRMKRWHQVLLTLLAFFILTTVGRASVVIDDTFADGTRTNWNLPDEAPWYSWTSGSSYYLGVATNALYCTNTPGVTRYFWTYFTSNAPELTIPYTDGIATNPISNTASNYYGYPIDIGIGQTVQATLVFSVADVLIATGTSPMRFGLMDYDTNNVAGGANGRVIRDTSQITKSGTGISGYRLDLPIYQTLQNNALLGFRYRFNDNVATDEQDPMGKAGVWSFIGAGPTLTNYTGFQPNTVYTLVWSVQRFATSNVLAASLSGGSFTNLDNNQTFTNFTYQAIDASGSNYHRFDSFMMRFDTASIPTDLFIVNELKVEILPLNFPITVVDKFNDDSTRLKWNTIAGQNYQIQYKANLTDPAWTAIETVMATTTTLTWTNTGLTGIGQRFYRVVNTP